MREIFCCVYHGEHSIDTGCPQCNENRTRTFGARAPSVTPTVVHITEIREWRQKQEENYNKLVTFVRELSQAKAFYPSNWYRVDKYEVIDERWKSDAIKLLSTIEN